MYIFKATEPYSFASFLRNSSEPMAETYIGKSFSVAHLLPWFCQNLSRLVLHLSTKVTGSIVRLGEFRFS